MDSNAFYGADLAFIHDVGFGGYARRAAPALLALLRQSGITSGLVVDLGCGSGIWARELCDAGYRVLGVDISPAMIRIAKKHAPKGKFQISSLSRVKLPPCMAVTALGECFNYMPMGWRRGNLLRIMFGRIFEALIPGGILIFDIAVPGRAAGPHRKSSEGRDWAVLLEVDSDDERQRLTRRITTFRRRGKLFRRSQEVHRIQLWRRSTIRGELRAAGFRVHTVTGYGNYRFLTGVVGFLARKPM